MTGWRLVVWIVGLGLGVVSCLATLPLQVTLPLWLCAVGCCTPYVIRRER